MTLYELLDVLKEQAEECGDVQVRIDSYDFYQSIHNIKEVYYDNDIDKLVINITR